MKNHETTLGKPDAPATAETGHETPVAAGLFEMMQEMKIDPRHGTQFGTDQGTFWVSKTADGFEFRFLKKGESEDRTFILQQQRGEDTLLEQIAGHSTLPASPEILSLLRSAALKAVYHKNYRPRPPSTAN